MRSSKYVDIDPGGRPGLGCLLARRDDGELTFLDAVLDFSVLYRRLLLRQAALEALYHHQIHQNYDSNGDKDGIGALYRGQGRRGRRSVGSEGRQRR